jgi:hypothetical protein
MTRTAERIATRDNARHQLRELFPVGSTVNTQLLHVSRSGMLRSIAVLVPGKNGAVRDVSYLVAEATGSKIHKPTGGVAMGGCGMDMGFALVYSLGRSLYPDGQPCTGSDGYSDDGPRCTSNDHVNERGDVYRAGFRKGRVHSDSGYALNHRWV